MVLARVFDDRYRRDTFRSYRLGNCIAHRSAEDERSRLVTAAQPGGKSS